VSISVYQNRLRAIRLKTAQQVTAQWDRLPDYNAARVSTFAQQATRIVAQGQMRAALITTGYVARVAHMQPPHLTAADVTGQAARNVDPLAEYERPFTVYDDARANGVEAEQAQERGRGRAELLALTDVWLACRVANQILQASNDRITGWQRVADATACDLCSAADGMQANDAAEMAGHPNCGCTNEPTFADTAPSEAADPEAIDIQQHGEMGAILTRAGDTFTEEP
jgi:hypothetical protein